MTTINDVTLQAPTNITEYLISPFPARLRLLKLCGAKLNPTPSDFELFAELCRLMKHLSATALGAVIQREVELLLGRAVSINEDNRDMLWRESARVLLLTPKRNETKNCINYISPFSLDSTSVASGENGVLDLSSVTFASLRDARAFVAQIERLTQIRIDNCNALESALGSVLELAAKRSVFVCRISLSCEQFVVPSPYHVEAALSKAHGNAEASEELGAILCHQIVRTVGKLLKKRNARLELHITGKTYPIARLLSYLSASGCLPKTNLIVSVEQLLRLTQDDTCLLADQLTVEFSSPFTNLPTPTELQTLLSTMPLVSVSAVPYLSEAEADVLKAMIVSLNDVLPVTDDDVEAFICGNTARFYLGE